MTTPSPKQRRPLARPFRPTGRRRPWLTVNLQIFERAGRPLLITSQRRPTLFSYSAAAHLTGLGCPEEQASFLRQACGLTSVAIACETMIVVQNERERTTHYWRTPLTAKQIESPGVLQGLAKFVARRQAVARDAQACRGAVARGPLRIVASNPSR